MLCGIFHRNHKTDAENRAALEADGWKNVADYCNCGKGSNKIYQLCFNLLKWPEVLHRAGFFSLSDRCIACLRGSMEKVSSAISVSIITKWPTSINIFRTAVQAYQKTSPKDTDKKEETLTKAIREGTECMGADSCRFLSFLTASKILTVSSMILKSLGLVGCAFSLCIDSLDTRLSCGELTRATARKAVTDMEKLDRNQKIVLENLNILKKVAGVAATVFTIISIIAGISFTGVILLFGLTSIVLTIAAELYKNSTHQALVKEAKVAVALA